jgi:photosystem II stability/assembly factor-like uncharacterized protein
VSIAVHGAFWRGATRDEFVAKRVLGLDLVVPGNGAGSNLVKALKGESPFGADLDAPPSGARFDRMPSGLPPVSPGNIAFIQKWIDDGCPADDDGGAAGGSLGAGRATTGTDLRWRPTNAPVASSRTDDIWFTDPQTGWAVNSNGQIVHTTDGGDTWPEQFHDPEVYFRCIGFAGPARGWAGTLTAGKTLFETRDGATWSAVTNLPPLAPSAVCGMSVVNDQVVYLAGTNFPNRPPRMMKTVDGGASCSAWDMRPWASILIDTYFTSPEQGWVVGGKTDEAVPTRNNVKAVVLFTADGGRTWENRAAGLQAVLPKGEWGWKIQFLDDRVGFVSLENFTAGAILKTTDGGATWTRIPINDPQQNANLEGVGFIDEQTGWVGGWGDARFQRLSTSATTDGGRTWQDANDVGRALNRFRFFGNPVSVGYASGQTVYKYTSQPVPPARTTTPVTPAALTATWPSRASGPLRLPVNVPEGLRRFSVRVWDRFGDHVATPVDESDPAAGPRTIEWDRGERDPGYFIIRVTADATSESRLVHAGPPSASGSTLVSFNNSGGFPMASVSHVVLPGSERRMSPGAKLMGPAKSERPVAVTVKLRRKKPLPDLEDRPRIPISRKQASAEYGASPADAAKVKDVLGRYGLTFFREDLPSRSVEFTGTVPDLEKAFEVKLFQFAHADGEFRGRSGTLSVPAELDGIVEAVYGLDNRKVVQRRRRRPGATPVAALARTTATHRGFYPAELAKLYDFPPGDGTDQVIGILEFGGGYLPDDLEAFCQQAGVGVPKVIPVSVDDASTTDDNDFTIEVMLDIEVVAGVCPKATIPVYFGASFDERSWIDTLDRAIHDQVNNPYILSISWGAAEEDSAWSQGTIDRVNDSLKLAAMMGITVCVSSGDDGSADQTDSFQDPNALDGKAHVDFPASSPFVLAVGGTDLRVREGQALEKTWKDGNGRRPFPGGTGTGGATGGGVSTHFPRPAFQGDINISSVNPGSIVGRVIPDVAAHAQSDNRTTGYIMVEDGNGLLVGGTSAATPLWAALIARINAALSQAGGGGPAARVGYLTPLLYQPDTNGQPVGASVCKDITQGDNISAAVGGYRAGVGYDAVTGWGSPIGSALLAALKNIVLAPPPAAKPSGS